MNCGLGWQAWIVSGVVLAALSCGFLIGDWRGPRHPLLADIGLVAFGIGIGLIIARR